MVTIEPFGEPSFNTRLALVTRAAYCRKWILLYLQIMIHDQNLRHITGTCSPSFFMTSCSFQCTAYGIR